MTATTVRPVKPSQRAFPLLALFPLIFLSVFFGHYTLLRLPYFWDEGGYYIPAALDFFRTGTLIPQSTITNAHPPLPSILLAAEWHLTGFNILATRTFICLIAAAALLAVYLLARAFIGTRAAVAVTLLTAVYPIFYVQSTLAHADIFAAAFTLWAIALYFGNSVEGCHPERSEGPAFFARATTIALLFSLSVLSKETAIVTPFALALHRLYLSIRDRKNRRTHLLWLATLGVCVLPLLAWYGFHYHRTGFVFGNPEFLRYNATANLDAHRIALALYHRALHLLTHMNMWAATLLTAACFLLPRRIAPSIPRAVVTSILILLIANWIAFSILGGALLTRYLLPMYPLLLLLFVALWRERTQHWPYLAALTAAAFLAALHVNPPYAFAPEDNLTYRDMIVLHQQAVTLIAQRFPQATVLTAWPANAELSRPDLGYTPVPIEVVTLQNFALDQLQKAAQSPGDFDTALLFSTKYEPPSGHANLSQHTQNSDARYFDFHRDVLPSEAAHLLHGEVLWQNSRNGEWAAVLRFPRSFEAHSGEFYPDMLATLRKLNEIGLPIVAGPRL
ncbi:MAG: glycosyltransferase family 39 protein [Acidobacteriota bacterium]|nr:glycosyltransferase family 39 protein [Acidobacteriota bacterium]